MRFRRYPVIEKLWAGVRPCPALWLLVLIAVLVTSVLWGSFGPAAVRAFQSPQSPLESPTASSEPLPEIATPSATPPSVPPVQEPAHPNPATRLLLWIGIGLLVVAAVVGVVLLAQRRG